MAIITQGNWSFQEPPLKDGDIIEGGNYTQLLPDSEICKDVKDLIIKGGNFVNCKPQPTWKITGGNWCQKSFCSHEHPGWVKDGLPICPENCAHRKGDTKQEVVIGVEEYKALRADLSPKKLTTSIMNETD